MLLDGAPHIDAAEKTRFINNFDGFAAGLMGALGAAWMLPFKLLGPAPDLVDEASVAYNYAIEIHRTFEGGRSEVGSRRVSLRKSGAVIGELGLPYWIIQTSVSSGTTPPKSSHRYSFDDIFELTPEWIGSRSTGYMRSYVDSLTLMHAMVASAAATDTPRNDDVEFSIPDWVKSFGYGLGTGIYLQDGQAVFLADGGFTENQAVVPLLDRGCQTAKSPEFQA
ncbi:hypothetical protein SJ279_25620 [Citrobacter freundii]|uniref:hypothetical protein n=1 Tax=Citrobacter freundii TaxID=546 RepID=UPI0029D5D2EC|nr:hypothetical protein [Citrobacter freundii]MDX7080671.1 hypothetical protein [Citrobacter freundii]